MTMRRKKTEASHAVGGLFTFALFGVYVLLSLMIVVIGVNGYRNVVNQGESLGAVRTALGYVESKINSRASEDGISLGDREGVRALTLHSHTEDDIPLETVIYFLDGALYESYFDPAEMEFDPEFGEMLAEVENFAVGAVQNNLLRLTATAADGRTQTLHVALVGGQEVQP